MLRPLVVQRAGPHPETYTVVTLLRSAKVAMAASGVLCVKCRGSRYLCGRAFCPVMVRALTYYGTKAVQGRKEVCGSSPPSVFVGKAGYPWVLAGPAAPPARGDTSAYDRPEMWPELPLERVLSYRFSLVLGRGLLHVRDVGSKLALTLQELALSQRPVDVEMLLEKPPRPVLVFDEHAAPRGPAAPLRSIRVLGNVSTSKAIEKAYYDTDLRASEAVILLYESGVPVSHIQKLLSVGCLGTRRLRRLVPTRWSVTAVDDVISRRLVDEVKGYEPINAIEAFVRRCPGNLFVAILAPEAWSFEWMEAWFPGSTWNPLGDSIVIEGDYEGFGGRTNYASIGGCYYAARLATAEYLRRRRRQAAAVVFREIYPGFNLPVGVWFVRENLRLMYEREPVRFDTLGEAVEYVSRFTKVRMETWLSNSKLLRRLMTQRKLPGGVSGGRGDIG